MRGKGKVFLKKIHNIKKPPNICPEWFSVCVYGGNGLLESFQETLSSPEKELGGPGTIILLLTLLKAKK